MQYYKDFLLREGYTVNYISSIDEDSDIRQLVKTLAASGIETLHVCDPTDDWLQKRLMHAAQSNGMELITHPSPNFLTPLADGQQYFYHKRNYFQTDFYVWQRKRLKLLLHDDSTPLGGKWTFDTENRLKYPKGRTAPAVRRPEANDYRLEANSYVQQYFPDNPGELSEDFSYPCTHEAAKLWLEDFVRQRLDEFGAYEDAMVMAEHILHHSVLTPMLNIGLLQPIEIIEAVITHAAKNNIALNSLEGFVRQVVGWREFIRMVYVREGRKQRTTNYWQFKRKIPGSFYTATTGILPVDITIKKVLKTGYNHHIERLMVLGNFFLLCEFDPDEVYRWFMEMYVDAYDWVMVPNVYGMTQFADGGLMTTKPYISGSNYLMKMGDWPKGDWQAIWDGLFWRFMHVHRDFFTRNPRLGMLVKTFDKMEDTKRQKHLTHAESFLNKLDEQATH
jgi:deoxyribodipyrimidine photolyase-related protein